MEVFLMLAMLVILNMAVAAMFRMFWSKVQIIEIKRAKPYGRNYYFLPTMGHRQDYDSGFSCKEEDGIYEVRFPKTSVSKEIPDGIIKRLKPRAILFAAGFSNIILDGIKDFEVMGKVKTEGGYREMLERDGLGLIYDYAKLSWLVSRLIGVIGLLPIVKIGSCPEGVAPSLVADQILVMKIADQYKVKDFE